MLRLPRLDHGNHADDSRDARSRVLAPYRARPCPRRPHPRPAWRRHSGFSKFHATKGGTAVNQPAEVRRAMNGARTWWWLVLTMTLVGTVGGYYLSNKQP